MGRCRTQIDEKWRVFSGQGGGVGVGVKTAWRCAPPRPPPQPETRAPLVLRSVPAQVTAGSYPSTSEPSGRPAGRQDPTDSRGSVNRRRANPTYPPLGSRGIHSQHRPDRRAPSSRFCGHLMVQTARVARDAVRRLEGNHCAPAFKPVGAVRRRPGAAFTARGHRLARTA